jgi:hypothetical protein
MVRQILPNNNEKCYRNFSSKIFTSKHARSRCEHVTNPAEDVCTASVHTRQCAIRYCTLLTGLRPEYYYETVHVASSCRQNLEVQLKRSGTY